MVNVAGRMLLSFLKSVALYLGVVVGGVTLFLIVAPLVGYVPYSDRPGPGWHGSFPAMSWSQFLSHSRGMLGFSLFAALLMSQFAAICVLVIRLLERLRTPLSVVRFIGGVLTAFLSAYGWLGVGWYIAIGSPAVTLAIVLGALAGAWLLPRRWQKPLVSSGQEHGEVRHV